MSRVGKRLIPKPSTVQAQVQNGSLKVNGPKGELSIPIPPSLSATVEGETITIAASSEDRKVRAVWGLIRTLASNAIEGVTKGFERRLVIVGIGYRVDMEGKNLRFILGYSHPIVFPAPDGIQFATEPATPGVEDAQATVVVRGIDKQVVGHVAAEIRMLRPPEPYKGKGIRYVGEYIRRKAGKTAA
ncbi:MAG: 50S ribosomal protein L6 [Candidatus Latescibacteria bacterium]|nr:50S ribosomal protein L6 [Candidatus Latescibacterota bacterium]